MGLYTTLPDEIAEVDVIIAGGGTAGCVVASRLSDADRSLMILVIEGGQDNYGMPTVVTPALFLVNTLPDSKTALFFKSGKAKGAADRELVVPSGGVLGGGSSINYLTYSRARRGDFEGWDVDGWRGDDMLPFLKKLETYHGPGSESVHGYDGPVHVSRGGFSVSRSEDDFLRAAEKLGFAEREDVQGFNSAAPERLGFQRSMRYISPDGKRQDAAHCYLHPRLRDGEHPNLHVVVESQVERVVFEDGRACGVVYRRNPSFVVDGDGKSGGKKTVRARKMVVLSCGALSTPGVLERSGVGRPDVLRQAGVPLVAEVPGVGEGLKDHNGCIHAYRSALEPEETMDGFIRGLPDVKPGPMLGWNGMDVTSKLRPSDEDVRGLGKVYEKYWAEEFRDAADKPMAIVTLINGFPGLPEAGMSGQYMGVSTFSTYPRSTGHVHITGPGMDDPLDFEAGCLSDAQGTDLLEARWMYKKQREIVRRMGVYRGEWASWHPAFAPSSPAACVEVDGPLPAGVEDIRYSEEDDAVIDQHIRERIGSWWHSNGSCKMGRFEEDGGVVDERLGVYGVKGLKVADLSILPGIVGANTNNTALAVGEKAAAIFIQELGL